ncbi:MAG TPA: hypothetical protein VJT72_17265 [Pseudonocardiaceae bacterium]|nr:hypothetical protein [Pseudonocardiaceae bacterium]
MPNSTPALSKDPPQPYPVSHIRIEAVDGVTHAACIEGVTLLAPQSRTEVLGSAERLYSLSLLHT